ncbi:MAG: hypothetical protein ABH871_06300 [Pseudomonadota bacterium]
MPRLWLKGYKGAFLDVRPVSRFEGYGLSVQLRIKPSRGCSGFVVHEEYLWADGETLLDVIRRFIIEGNLTIPGRPSVSGVQFRLQYRNDDISILKVSCRKNENHAEFSMEFPTRDAWRFIIRLLNVCECVVASG